MVDHDGGILIVNSSTTRARHSLFRLVPDGTNRDWHHHERGCRDHDREHNMVLGDGLPESFARLGRQGKRDLLLPPAVDEFGYTLALRKHRRDNEVVVRRVQLGHPGQVECSMDWDDDDGRDDDDDDHHHKSGKKGR